MGKLMLYGAGRSAQVLQTGTFDTNSAMLTVPEYKDTSGTTHTGLDAQPTSGYYTRVPSNLRLHLDLTGYVSADTEFDKTDYTVKDIANISYTRSATHNRNGQIYTIAAKNNGTSAVTVGSIKFTKLLFMTENNSKVQATCLTHGYFLDTPVTIEPGATKTFAVNIDCWNY